MGASLEAHQDIKNFHQSINLNEDINLHVYSPEKIDVKEKTDKEKDVLAKKFFAEVILSYKKDFAHNKGRIEEEENEDEGEEQKDQEVKDNPGLKSKKEVEVNKKVENQEKDEKEPKKEDENEGGGDGQPNIIAGKTFFGRRRSNNRKETLNWMDQMDRFKRERLSLNLEANEKKSPVLDSNKVRKSLVRKKLAKHFALKFKTLTEEQKDLSPFPLRKAVTGKNEVSKRFSSTEGKAKPLIKDIANSSNILNQDKNNGGGDDQKPMIQVFNEEGLVTSQIQQNQEKSQKDDLLVKSKRRDSQFVFNSSNKNEEKSEKIKGEEKPESPKLEQSEVLIASKGKEEPSKVISNQPKNLNDLKNTATNQPPLFKKGTKNPKKGRILQNRVNSRHRSDSLKHRKRNAGMTLIPSSTDAASQPIKQLKSSSNLTDARKKDKKWSKKIQDLKDILERFTIIDHRNPKKIKKAALPTRYVQKISHWFLYFGMRESFKQLMRDYYVSPFIINAYGYNSIHILSMSRNSFLLNSILELNYHFKDSEDKFSIVEAVNIPSKKYLNNAAHLCITEDDYASFKVLKKYKISLDAINIRGWDPLSLIPRNSKEFLEQKMMRTVENGWANLIQKDFNQVSCTKQELQNYEMSFDFCILANDNGDKESKDPLNQMCTMEKQLRLVQLKHGKHFLRVFSCPGHDKTLDIKGRYKYCMFWKFIKASPNDLSEFKIILIKFGRRMMKSYAKTHGIRVFNFRRNFLTNYKHSHRMDYEPFSEIQKHFVFLHFLKKEVNITNMKKSGLLIDCFPVHHFHQRKEIGRFWKQHQLYALFDPIIPFLNRRESMRPFTQIAFYHGLQNGFVFGFLVTFTSWCIPLAIFGILISLAQNLDWGPGAGITELSLVSWVGFTLWGECFLVGWARRENCLAYCFDSYGFEDEEPEREEYQGEFVIDPVTKWATKDCYWTAYRKRLLVSFFQFF